MQSGQTISFPQKNGYRMVRVSEILHCKANGNYTHIFLENGQELKVCRRLKEIETLLPEEGFCRIHHSHLVNMAAVEMWVRGNGDFLRMRGGAEVPVARSRRKTVRSLLKI